MGGRDGQARGTVYVAAVLAAAALGGIGCDRPDEDVGLDAAEPPSRAPADALTGDQAPRLEHEIKLALPKTQAEALWTYLQRRYLSAPWTAQGRQLSAERADERFRDHYYDTDELRLLRRASGVRHRAREIPGDTANRKNGRELVQVKLAGDTNVTRTEIKFPVRRSQRGAREPAPSLLTLVPRKHHAGLTQVLAKLGIAPEALRPVLSIEQRRRRIYVSDAEGPLATLTLDESVASRGPRRTEIWELEVELNELRYTRAAPAVRASMERLAAEVSADCERRFPAMEQDQTPKYNKAFRALGAPDGSARRAQGRRAAAVRPR